LFLALSTIAGCGSPATKCEPGKLGCACALGSCQAGAVCEAGTCKPEARSGLSVDSSAARACEVLLGDGTTRIDRVEFAADVTGKWLRQGDKVAAAFVANRDTALGGSPLDVAYPAGSSMPFSVVASHCYGGKGEELSNVTVHR
jgi:hypothetical protein